jgi:chemotaxis protein MotB
MKKHKKEHHEEHTDESWLVPYADILTLLLALFIILFASSQVDQKKYEQVMQGLNSAFSGGPSMLEGAKEIREKDTVQQDDSIVLDQDPSISEALKKETEDMAEIKRRIDHYIAENDLSAQLETKLNPEMLMISIQDNALFDSGSAVIKPESQKLAIIISEMLKEYPNYNVEVAGHTDNIPINNREFETNWDLSVKRSLNFMKYLLKTNSIDEARFRTIGYGEYHPVATNSTEEGRAKNRRVEINILRNIGQAANIIQTNPS